MAFNNAKYASSNIEVVICQLLAASQQIKEQSQLSIKSTSKLEVIRKWFGKLSENLNVCEIQVTPATKTEI